MSDHDGGDDGGSSGRLLITLWSIPRYTATAQSSALCIHLAVLHDSVDGCSVGSISLLPRTATWHLLGSA